MRNKIIIRNLCIVGILIRRIHEKKDNLDNYYENIMTKRVGDRNLN